MENLEKENFNIKKLLHISEYALKYFKKNKNEK